MNIMKINLKELIIQSVKHHINLMVLNNSYKESNNKNFK